MEALKKHKINYLSPSSIATFIENPAIYVLEKIFKYKFTTGAAAKRGIFIERGVNQILSGDNIDPFKNIAANTMIVEKTSSKCY